MNLQTIVYTIFGDLRTNETMKQFVDDMKNKDQCFAMHVEVACTDMWAPYRKLVEEELPNAKNVIDRFHIMKHINDCLDQIRMEDCREISDDREKWSIYFNVKDL